MLSCMGDDQQIDPLASSSSPPKSSRSLKAYNSNRPQSSTKRNTHQNNRNDNTQGTTTSTTTTITTKNMHPMITKRDAIARSVKERNSWSTYYEPTALEGIKMLSNYTRRRVKIPSPEVLDEDFPIRDVDWSLIKAASASTESSSVSGNGNDVIQSTWIGHASLLVQMGGWNILTDPVFEERCSPVQSAGPKRYRRPAFTIQELMIQNSIHIDVVLISHNHYDHLEYNTIKEIAKLSLTHHHHHVTNTNDGNTNNRRRQQQSSLTFVVPLGLKAWFEKHIPASHRGRNRVIELDWHQSTILEGGVGGKTTNLKITGLPMQHWSNRYVFDKDLTLWCGYAVTTSSSSNTSSSSSNKSGDDDLKYMFSGDTGYFEGVKAIGETYGPFDLAAIPIGAYEPRQFMKPAHMNPEDAVQFMQALRARMATPIHWGTFQLTIEPLLEPRERLGVAMDDTGLDRATFAPLLIGETLACRRSR